MATFKMSFANLLAFFEHKPHGDDVDNGIEPTKVSTNETHDKEVRHNGADLDAEVKNEVDVMVQVVWEKLIRYLNGCTPNEMDKLFCSSSHDLLNKGSVKVAKEIFRREMMNIIDNAYDSVKEENRAAGKLSEDQYEVNSMNRRLRELEQEAMRAREALRQEQKERYYVQFERDDYEQKYFKLSSAAYVWKKERKDLEKKNDILLKKSQQRELENEELRAEKDRNEIRALQAEHDAEMARLVATQLGLQAHALDKQLKESKRMVSAISERVEKLERVQDDMREELSTSHDGSNSYSRRRVEGLLRKSSALLGFFGSRLSCWRSEIRNDGDEAQEDVEAEDETRREDEHIEREAEEKVIKDTPARGTEEGDELVAGALYKLMERLRLVWL